MDGLPYYLEKLREFIPARTLALYLLGIGLATGIADSPEQVVTEYGWLILLVTGACLVFNFVGRLFEKRGFAAAAISSGAFLLIAMTQRFTGPLAALGVDSKGVFVAFEFLAVLYVAVITMVWHPKKPIA
jgi:hypothetical protein